MDKLEELASVTRLSDTVVRVLGKNPGKFTLQGTNTYLIGTQRPYTLLDTGEGKQEYIPVLAQALSDHCTGPDDQPDVSDIILSHEHHDHVGGIPSVLAFLHSLWRTRNPDSSATFAPPRLHKLVAQTPDPLVNVLSQLPVGSFAPAPDGAPLHVLADGQTLGMLRVLHTPGHTPDSLALHMPGTPSVLFTADSVLGQGTAVFADLGTYMSSLRRMAAFARAAGGVELYPGHGPVVHDGVDTIEMYVRHRDERESQIISVLERKPDEGEEWTLWGIVGDIYKAYPQNLWEPAAHGVGLHLKKLLEEGRVRNVAGEGKQSQWSVAKA